MAHAVLADDATIAPDTFTHLDGYLDNLAAAASTECTTLVQLINNNATLMANVTSLTASVASLTAAYTMLAAALHVHRPSPRLPKPTNALKGVRKGGGVLLDARIPHPSWPRQQDMQQQSRWAQG